MLQGDLRTVKHDVRVSNVELDKREAASPQYACVCMCA